MLSRIVDGILNLPPALLAHWGYSIIFLISILESLPLIGLAIPGGVVVIASGFFVKIGILQLVPTIVIVSIGAFLGDAISYMIGWRYGYDFLVRIGKYIFFKPAHFEKAKKLLQSHPRKAIFLGRFHALTRCIVPFAAGSADVAPGLFFPFAAFSALCWATLSVLVGFVFGQGFEVASHYLGAIFFIALCVSILMVYSYQFISRFTVQKKQVLSRYQIYPLLLNLISLFAVAKISESVLMGSRIHRLDIMVYRFFALIRQPFVTRFFIILTTLATPTNLAVLGCVLAAYFMVRHRWYFLALLPASLFSGIISDSILKKLVHVSRPLNPLVATTDFSFPSGHATVAIIFFGLLAYFFKDSIRSKAWRRVYIAVCAFFALLICISRLYLNAHWFSDVLAGAALGVFWLTLYIVLFHFFTSLSPKSLEHELQHEIDEEDALM